MVHKHRFLLIIYPAQSHINPTLQFAKRLIAINNAHVTLAITLHMHRRMPNKPTIPGLSLVTFSDGYDDGFSVFTGGDDDYRLYASELKRRGSQFLTNLIVSSAKQGHPFTCLTYTLLVPWAHEVARGFHIPAALLWIEPATVFSIAYYYFHGYDEYINDKIKGEEAATSSSRSIAIPGLPLLLSPCDIPTFLTVSVSKALSFIFPLFQEQFRVLDMDTNNPTVLVNTFEALEPDALRGVDGVKMIPIGPLIPSAFLDGKDPNDRSFGGDIFKPSNDDYAEWLDSQEELSVVYVSFGSYFELSKTQEEEIARALLDCGRPFLWVIREKQSHGGTDQEVMSFTTKKKELESLGKIVKWCSQVEVLSHASLGCFVTHCGWNSTMESLVSGVPVVAFPQWADQKTNAKLIEDVWKTGVRVDLEVNREGIVEAEAIRRCLDVVMGSEDKAIELRLNAQKWKILGKEAGIEGGPLEKNITDFVNGRIKSYSSTYKHN